MFLLSLMGMALAAPSKFTQYSATTLDKGEWSIGVFAPLKYGLTETVELSVAGPVWALAVPHLRVKKRYESVGSWSIASQHQLGYPTPLKKQLAREGTGGVLPPDSRIPHTVVLQNDVYAGTTVFAGELTLSAGASFAMEFGESDYPTIDYAYGFRQTNLYQNKLTLQLGGGWERFVTERIGIRTWSKIWAYPLAEEQWVVEQRDALLFQVSERSQAMVGVNLSVAEYPWGIQWHAFPVADWAWLW